MMIVEHVESGGVRRIELNRPEKKNALNLDTLEAFHAAFDRAEADHSIRLLVVSARGDVFCAGMDLVESSDPAIGERLTSSIQSAFKRLRTSRLTTVAKVAGQTLAGGVGIVAACDFAVASDRATFSLPELRRGLAPAMVIALLRRKLPETELRRLVFTGSTIDAREAKRIGLVAEVAAAESLDEALSALSAELSTAAPSAAAAVKQLFEATWPGDLDADLDLARATLERLRRSGEAAEGSAAFREKRLPNWLAAGHPKVSDD